MVNINLTDTGKRTILLTPKKKDGTQATVDTTDFFPEVESVEGDSTGTVTITEDGKLAVEAVSGNVPEGQDTVLHRLRLHLDKDPDAGEDKRISEDIVITLSRSQDISSFDAEVGDEQDKA